MRASRFSDATAKFRYAFCLADGVCVHILLGTASEQGFKFSRYQLSMPVKHIKQGRPVGKVHRFGDPLPVIFIRGQQLGLLVIQVLQAMLKITQECVCRL